MVRFAPGLVGFVFFCFWVWAVLDVIATDRILVRNLDKTLWLFLVIFVPTIGAVAWIALGRPVDAGFTPGSTAVRQPPRSHGTAPLGLEDSDHWSSRSSASAPRSSGHELAAEQRRLEEWEAELRKRESDLGDRDPD